MSALDQPRVEPAALPLHSVPGAGDGTEPFEELESAARSYCRKWPVVFRGASGTWLYDEIGRSYLDFFTGAGSLNYGHNNPVLRDALIDYIASDGIVQALDMYTTAKRDFLLALEGLILAPRGLSYRVQFPGPGGANAVEAALKLARKVTGRRMVICFDNAFHGVTLGSLSVTSNPYYRKAAGVPLRDVTRLPFDARRPDGSPDLTGLERLLRGSGNGSGPPAGVIVEAVQGEGGMHAASQEWLAELAEHCRHHGVPLILDDIQMGCGRTGTFFGFEIAGIKPDIVCLSKSISGFGLPLALTLIREDLDRWEPGEHNGTFRGVSPSFVTGAAALRKYWSDDVLEHRAIALGDRIEEALLAIAAAVPTIRIQLRGRGMARGLAFESGAVAARVVAAAFGRRLLVETSGPSDEVVKLLPPLTITDAELDHGLALLADSVGAAAIEAE